MKFKTLKLKPKIMYQPTIRGFNQVVNVEIYCAQSDIYVIDKKTGFIIGRPWTTLGIDVLSRMISCMNISFEEPSYR
jgi:putative transposase